MLVTGKLLGNGRYSMTRVIAPMRKPLPPSYQIEISDKIQVYENDKNITAITINYNDIVSHLFNFFRIDHAMSFFI